VLKQVPRHVDVSVAWLSSMPWRRVGEVEE